MLRHLVRQLDARVLELGSWTEGELAFTSGLRPGLTAPQALGAPGELACRLIRRSYCDDEIRSFLTPLDGTPFMPLVSRPAFAGDILLLDVEARVLDAAPGHTLDTLLSDLDRKGTARPEDARRAVFLGLSAGLLESAEWASPHGASGVGAFR